jgi:hypothetical protein
MSIRIQYLELVTFLGNFDARAIVSRHHRVHPMRRTVRRRLDRSSIRHRRRHHRNSWDRVVTNSVMKGAQTTIELAAIAILIGLLAIAPVGAFEVLPDNNLTGRFSKDWGPRCCMWARKREPGSDERWTARRNFEAIRIACRYASRLRDRSPYSALLGWLGRPIQSLATATTKHRRDMECRCER